MDPRKTLGRTWRSQERKRSQNNQSLYRESQVYQPDMNSLKAIKQRNWKSWWRTVYRRLMNESIVRSKTRGSPRWREKTMMITCSSKPDLSLHESLYHPQHPWVGVLHQINAKNFLQRNWIKSVWRAISRLWDVPERDSCMQIRRRQLGGEPPVHSRNVSERLAQRI